MSDFSVPSGDFNDTTITFVANTDAAKRRIWGGVSVAIYKSAAPEFWDQLESEGFTVSLQ